MMYNDRGITIARQRRVVSRGQTFDALRRFVVTSRAPGGVIVFGRVTPVAEFAAPYNLTTRQVAKLVRASLINRAGQVGKRKRLSACQTVTEED